MRRVREALWLREERLEVLRREIAYAEEALRKAGGYDLGAGAQEEAPAEPRYAGQWSTEGFGFSPFGVRRR